MPPDTAVYLSMASLLVLGGIAWGALSTRMGAVEVRSEAITKAVAETMMPRLEHTVVWQAQNARLIRIEDSVLRIEATLSHPHA